MTSPWEERRNVSFNLRNKVSRDPSRNAQYLLLMCTYMVTRAPSLEVSLKAPGESGTLELTWLKLRHPVLPLFQVQIPLEKMTSAFYHRI